MRAIEGRNWSDLVPGRVHYVVGDDLGPRLKSLRQWARRRGMVAHTVRLKDYALVVIEGHCATPMNAS